jgi:hypothetical protein
MVKSDGNRYVVADHLRKLQVNAQYLGVAETVSTALLAPLRWL